MEFILWFSGVVMVTMVTVKVMQGRWFQSKLLVKQPPKPVVPKTLRQVHEDDHTLWLEDYKRILQRGCDHLYHHQNWYTCLMCGYEEPWEYREGCRCEKVETKTLTDIHPTYALTKRQSFCIVHGIDFKAFPVSDRKRGPYGPQSDLEDAVKRSRELTTGRSLRRLSQDIEGSN